MGAVYCRVTKAVARKGSDYIEVPLEGLKEYTRVEYLASLSILNAAYAAEGAKVHLPVDLESTVSIVLYRGRARVKYDYIPKGDT